jgi:CarD family transcriptional regulator
MCARSTHSAKLPQEPRRAARRPVASRPRRKPASKAKSKSDEEMVCEEALPLRVGDKVVFPPHGVVEVVGMERHEIEGEAQQFYSLKSVNNGLRVMIPASRTNPGLRAIVTEEEITAAFVLLRKRKKVIDGPTWSKRQKACLERLRTGSIFDIADVLRDLYLTKRDKELSIAERRLLETTHELFVTEAALATRRTEDDVDAELRVIFRLKRPG